MFSDVAPSFAQRGLAFLLCLQVGCAVCLDGAQARGLGRLWDNIIKSVDDHGRRTNDRVRQNISPGNLREQRPAKGLQRAPVSGGLNLLKTLLQNIKHCGTSAGGDRKTVYVSQGSRRRVCFEKLTTQDLRSLGNRNMLLHVVLRLLPAIDKAVHMEMPNAYLKFVIFRAVDSLHGTDLLIASMESAKESKIFERLISQCLRDLRSDETELDLFQPEVYKRLKTCYRKRILGSSWPGCSFAYLPKVACDLPPL